MNIDTEDIHIINRNSNWTESSIRKILKEQVYNNSTAWKKLLKILFITLGVGFIVSGIIFFFAYNWANMGKFTKLGLMEGLIVVVTLAILIFKITPVVKDIMLTGASVLVGVLFAVFGQIYQTGANAYDFFLGWTIFITLWVLISSFPPLWLIYIALIDTTIMLYSEQVAREWMTTLVYLILYASNVAVLIVSLNLPRLKADIKIPPVWFTNVLALACVSFATMGLFEGIFSYQSDPSMIILLFITAGTYAIGIKYAFKERSIFYLSIIPFSIIIIVCCFLIKASEGEGMVLLASLFIVGSVSFLVKYLFDLQKKWSNG